MANNEHIKLAFEPSILEALISNGLLHATDFSCVDATAKSSVWRILRSVTARRLRGLS
jgi:hypothetical protein